MRLAGCPEANRLLALLSPRQVAVAAHHLDGLSEREIADREGVDQSTVSRDLARVRKACEAIGQVFPEPPRLLAANEIQLPRRVHYLLYGSHPAPTPRRKVNREGAKDAKKNNTRREKESDELVFQHDAGEAGGSRVEAR